MSNEASNVNRDKERLRIERQVEQFLNQGGAIQKLDSHIGDYTGAPPKAVSNDIGVF